MHPIFYEAFFTFALSVISLYAVPQQLPSLEKNSSPTISAPHFGEKLKLLGLPNGGKINDSLFRGARPLARQFHNNLNTTTTRGSPPGQFAKLVGQASRIRRHSLHQYSRERLVSSNEFLSLSIDPHEKAFVHCRFIDDRTSVFIASYLIPHDGWLADQASKEMSFFGFNGRWHHSRKAYVKEFPFGAQGRPALAPEIGLSRDDLNKRDRPSEPAFGNLSAIRQ